MPRREVPTSLKRNDILEEFGTALKQKRRALKLSQDTLSQRVGEGIDQSTISRIERGVLNLTWSLANDVMRAARFRPDEIEDWLSYLFGIAPGIEPHEIEPIAFQLDFHLRRGIREHPKNSSYFGGFVANRLEHALHRKIDKAYVPTVHYLAQKARLLEAWGQSSYLPFTAYTSIVERLVDTIDELPNNHELYQLGTVLINTTKTMLTEDSANIDELEQLVSRSTTPHSLSGALVYDELARQYLMSSVHTLEQLMEVLEAGKQYCRQSPALQSQVLCFELLAARATFEKGGDPLVAVNQMGLVTRKLRRPEHFNPSMLVETLGLEARMRLATGHQPRAAIHLLNEAYGWARYMGNRYGMGWIEREANQFDIQLVTADHEAME